MMSGFKIPKMSHHQASDQAVVRLAGKDFYLGPWGTKVARIEYDRVIAEWLAAGRRPSALGVDAITVTEVLAAFWSHAERYYRYPDGTQTNELKNYRDALRYPRRLYGHTPAHEFGPLALKAVREAMIGARLSRTNINRQIGRVKHVFKWAVENELIPPSVHHGLQAVSGLKAGRSEAHESDPVHAVPEERVSATLPFVSRQVAAMIRLQLLTGMRPGEIVAMRGVDIDTTGHLWRYQPARHKTQHLGHARIVFLGPKARKIVQQFLKSDLSAFLFSPTDAETERRAALHARRTTPLSCGNVPGSNVRRKPKKHPGDHFTVISYGRAIKYGCDAAFPAPDHLQSKALPDGKREARAAWLARLTPEQKNEIKAWQKAHRWHPHQLRHTAATNLRKNYGLEPAQVILGHKTLTVTQVYAERNVEAAMRIMGEVG